VIIEAAYSSDKLITTYISTLHTSTEISKPWTLVPHLSDLYFTASAINCNARTFMHTASRTRVLVMQLGSIRHAISFLSLFKWWCNMNKRQIWHTVLVYRMRSRDNNHCSTLFNRKNAVKWRERSMLTGSTELHQIAKHSDSMHGWWDKHENSFRPPTEMGSMLCIIIYNSFFPTTYSIE
jgi:hypothetical protein